MGKIRELHPDNIHSWLKNEFSYSRSSYDYIDKRIGEDDCSIITMNSDKLVTTSDFLNANTIMQSLNIGGYWDMGRLLIAVNLADLCGTGAKPYGFLTSLMLQKGFLESDFKDLMNGISFELQKHTIPLLGGDTKLGNATSLCGFAIGVKYSENSNFFTLSDAKPNQSIWVSGETGSVAAAVDGLTNSELKLTNKWIVWAKQIITTPIVPINKSKYLALNNIPSGGTDLSDGLSNSIHELCDASNIGVIIEADKIPVNKYVTTIAGLRKIAAWKYSLSIGGDFQFLFTADSKWDSILLKKKFTKIGITTNKKKRVLKFENSFSVLPRQGHTDYKIKTYQDEIRNHILKN